MKTETLDLAVKKKEPGKALSYLLIAAVGVLLVFSVIQSFQLKSLKDQLTGRTVSNVLDQSGWTENEKMMYEHHGTLPARLPTASKAGNLETIPAMVGGC